MSEEATGPAAGPGRDLAGPSFGAALVATATKASGLLWLTIASAGARPAWHVWSDGAAYLVHAREDVESKEQQLPGLGTADDVEVSVRGDKDGRVVTWRATVEHLEPGAASWDSAVELLRGSRLNETDTAGLAQRWAQTCGIVVLRPTGELLEEPGRYDQASREVPPLTSPATTVTTKPYVLGRRARRRPHL